MTPSLVERFTAEIATERTIQPPDHVEAPEGGVGFAVGGDRRSLHLHDEDVALIRAVAAANPRTIVAVVAGSAVVISEWDIAVPAIVQSWYSGMEGGHGLADVLLGRVDAAGRLPFSVPASPSDLPGFDPDSTAYTYDAWHGYWHLARNNTAPAYAFGFGLSYTAFSLGAVEVAVAGAGVRINATLTNLGDRTGTDVVQFYGCRVGASRPERLVGFQRLEVGPGGGGPSSTSRCRRPALPSGTSNGTSWWCGPAPAGSGWPEALSTRALLPRSCWGRTPPEHWGGTPTRWAMMGRGDAPPRPDARPRRPPWRST